MYKRVQSVRHWKPPVIAGDLEGISPQKEIESDLQKVSVSFYYSLLRTNFHLIQGPLFEQLELGATFQPEPKVLKENFFNKVGSKS